MRGWVSKQIFLEVKNKNKKKIIVCTSGGFDPVHIGHVRMFQYAKSLGDVHVVILNNDNWLRKKKGYAFMPERDRKEILESLKWVDKVVLTDHRRDPQDMSVCSVLAKIRPDIFANGGDRTYKNTPEKELCRRFGVRMVYNAGGRKVRSSSEMLRQHKLSLNETRAA